MCECMCVCGRKAEEGEGILQIPRLVFTYRQQTHKAIAACVSLSLLLLFFYFILLSYLKLFFFLLF